MQLIRLGIPAAVLCLSFLGCGDGGGDDDGDAGSAGDESGGTGGTGATGGTGGSAGKGGSSATGGSAGKSATQPIPGGPHPYPQSRTSGMCTITTHANAAQVVRDIYAYWKQNFLVSAGTGLRVTRGAMNGDDTVSEGIAYGMLMAVYLDDRPTFDGLWTYAMAHADSHGFMNWRINADGTTASDGAGSASDADEDMAWALLMASSQWQSGAYLDEAKRLINGMFTYMIGSDGMLLPGDGWGSTDRTFPDYFSPAYYRVFAQISGNPAWATTVIDKNYQILADVSGMYGLVPDSTTRTYQHMGAYGYDACRTPWRIAMDYCFFGEPRAKAYLDKIAPFFVNQGSVSNIGDGYSLTGQKTSSYANMAFIGPAGVSGMAGYQSLLDAAFQYGATGTGGPTPYYQQSLRVITMLMMSGNYLNFVPAP